MKVAVTYDFRNGQVFQHFGQTETFKVYEISEDGKSVLNSQVLDSGMYSHELLVNLLKQYGASILICGDIGPGAYNAVSSAGIKLYASCKGRADNVIEEFIAGTLQYTTEPTCSDHEHGAGHSCGSCRSCGMH